MARTKILAAGFACLMLAGCAAADRLPSLPFTGEKPAPREAYVADIEIVPGGNVDQETITGVVFDDANRDGRRQPGEKGVPGVRVSNGLAVAQTGSDGAYALPVREDMSVSVIQPAGWRVPTDANWVPQFSYEYKSKGSVKAMRFGGLKPAQALPKAVNFPLVRSGTGERFDCAVLGDVQVYSNTEIGYARDSLVKDFVNRGPGGAACMVLLGDVLGNDLGLIPRLASVLGAAQIPQWWVHGNHDIDFDADADADSADSWRANWGPHYYAFEEGDAIFIALDNILYPCGAEDAERPGRDFCITGDKKTYNGRVSDDQMVWLKALLDATPTDKTVVFMTHIPFVTFINQTSAQHQTDNVAEIFAMVEGREALSLAGHTHTLENLAPGDRFEGWQQAVGVGALPFRHIVAGAVAGSWWQGDADIDGVPMSLMRLGAPRGWMNLAFDGNAYVETYYGTGLSPERQMWLSINTPPYRAWFETLGAWVLEDPATRHKTPPVSINDLPDVKLLTPEDLAGGSYITADVWLGSSETTVSVRIDGGPPAAMTRTQEAKGEGARIGADYADPFAVQREASVGRYALVSRSGDARAQGHELFNGAKFGPSAPQPQTALSNQSVHLWRHALPPDLAPGVHVAEVTQTDRHGRTAREKLVFEVVDVRPPPRWRADVWDAFEDGPPVQ